MGGRRRREGWQEGPEGKGWQHKVSRKSTVPVPLYSVESKFQNINKVFLNSRLGPTLTLVAEKS